jgi:DEAD/DEAH box helicase
MPDDWQVHLIRRILQGYDSIFCAGTGYGKSLIFEGLAVLGGPKKLVIVISPLKALERDQVFKLVFSQLPDKLNIFEYIFFRRNMQQRRELMLLSLMKTQKRLLSSGNEPVRRLQSLTCPPRWHSPRLGASRNFGRIQNFGTAL